jgi:hypothetical protein
MVAAGCLARLPRLMRRLAAIAALVTACAVPLAIAGCGDSGGPGGSALNQALAFLPKDSPFVAVVDTDLEGSQYKNAGRILDKFPFGDQAERGLEQSLEEEGLDFQKDIKPVLGNPAVIGAPDVQSIVRDDEQVIVAFQAKDEDKLKDLVEKEQGNEEVGEKEGAKIYRDDEGDHFAIDGDLAVVADSRKILDAALERSGGDDHLEEDAFNEALDGLPEDALARIYADVESLLKDDPDTRDARKVKWVNALRTFGLTASVAGDSVNVEFNLKTESGELSEDDLPIASGGQAPQVVERPGELSFGLRDPSQIVDFAEQAGKAVNPRDFNDFQTAKRQIDRQLGVNIDQDIVEQLTGDVSVNVNVNGDFGARAEVKDPAAFERTLARVARLAPRISQGQIRSVRKSGDLYQAVDNSGETIVFGVDDRVFVASNDASRARRLSSASGEAVPGAEGSVAFTADAERVADQAIERLAPQIGLGGALGGQLFTGPLGGLTGSVSTDTDGMRGSFKLGID